jgi:hypothetical protein
MSQLHLPTDPGTYVIAYWITIVLVGAAIVVVGYRRDRTQASFEWDRYWHWWRVNVVYGLLGAVGVIPAGWLAYHGHPPSWIADATAGFTLLLVFGLPVAQWQLWLPVFGIGLDRRVYLRQALRTFGYSLAVALAGTIVLFVGSSALLAR